MHDADRRQRDRDVVEVLGDQHRLGVETRHGSFGRRAYRSFAPGGRAFWPRREQLATIAPKETLGRSEMQLAGKTVLITGAGRGLGAAMAEGLADRGANLALVDLDTAGLDAVRTACQALGVRAVTYNANVAVETDVVTHVRPSRRRLRPARRSNRERGHPARRAAREGQRRRRRRQALARPVAGRDRREPDRRIPHRPRSRGANDPAWARRLHREHLEPVARRQFRPEQLLGRQSRRRGADRRVGQRARAASGSA